MSSCLYEVVNLRLVIVVKLFEAFREREDFCFRLTTTKTSLRIKGSVMQTSALH